METASYQAVAQYAGIRHIPAAHAILTLGDLDRRGNFYLTITTKASRGDIKVLWITDEVGAWIRAQRRLRAVVKCRVGLQTCAGALGV